VNEQDVRALVREAIERQLGRPHVVSPMESPRPADHHHPSHTKLRIIPGSAEEDGMCVIEPSVRCTHCGFCQSYGH
jgi:hypothetical protein